MNLFGYEQFIGVTEVRWRQEEASMKKSDFYLHLYITKTLIDQMKYTSKSSLQVEGNVPQTCSTWKILYHILLAIDGKLGYNKVVMKTV